MSYLCLQPISPGARLPADPCTTAAHVGIFSLLEAEISLISPSDSVMHIMSCKHGVGGFASLGYGSQSTQAATAPTHIQKLSIPRPDTFSLSPAA